MKRLGTFERPANTLAEPDESNDPYEEIERIMPTLLDEMKKDLAEFPRRREVILKEKGWCYHGSGVLEYYYESHEDLEALFDILENHGMVREITFNEVKRYRLLEPFVKFLTKK